MTHRASKSWYNVTSTRQPGRPAQGRKPRNGQNTRGAIITLNRKKGVRGYQLVAG